MTERLNRVAVTHSRGEIELSRDARDKLVRRIRDLDAAKPIITRFDTATTSHPVEFGQDEKGFLVVAIKAWVADVGRNRVPGAVLRLRDAFIDDLNESTAAPKEPTAVADGGETAVPETQTEAAVSVVSPTDVEARAHLGSLLAAIEHEVTALGALHDARLDAALGAIGKARAEIVATLAALPPEEPSL